MKKTPKATNLLFLDGGGEMGEIIRTMDWEKSALGDIGAWPTSLCTTLGIILHSNFPMFLFWGEDLTCFYNDALIPSLGQDGMQFAMDKKGKVVRPKIWDLVGPTIQEVFRTGRPISFHNRRMPDERSEEAYWTYNCSAAYNDKGKVNGVFITCSQTTQHINAKRELQINTGISDPRPNEKNGAGRSDTSEQRIFGEELERQVHERTANLVKLNKDLKKSEQRYHLMVEEIQDYSILYLNRKGIVENWNRGATKIKGYKAKDIIGKNFSIFYTEKDRAEGLPKKLLGLAVQNNRAVQEGWRVRKDNSLFWASVVITAVHNEKDEVIGFSKVTHDLTEKKELDDDLRGRKAELEEKNIELQQMNKELESFAYISSHDLQEPLRKIQIFASRIAEKEHDSLSENGKYLFKRMQLSAERMQALIDDLLAYSRTHNLKGDFKKTDLGDLIEDVKQDFSEELLQKNAAIEIVDPCTINIIPFQFKQLFYNLLSNSIKFSHPGKPLHITIGNELVKGAEIKDLDLLKDTTYCHITYSDNGIGFDQQYSDKIFEIFQRLHGKTDYPGTGIGLAIIKRIVENHKGDITAEGRSGKGATFNIYIPTKGN